MDKGKVPPQSLYGEKSATTLQLIRHSFSADAHSDRSAPMGTDNADLTSQTSKLNIATTFTTYSTCQCKTMLTLASTVSRLSTLLATKVSNLTNQNLVRRQRII